MDSIQAVVVYLLVFLTAAVLLMSAYALADRWWSERRQARVLRIRARQLEQLHEHLSGQLPQAALLTRWRGQHKIACGVLLQAAGARPRAERSDLHRLFVVLELEQRALKDLRQRSPSLRASAATRLGYLGSDAAVLALRSALDDSDLDARLAIAQALAELGDAEAAPMILASIALPGEWPLRRATEILMAIGPAVVAPLQTFLARREPGDSGPGDIVAVQVLGMLAAGQALPVLLQRLRHPDSELRASSAKALGGIGDPRAAPALVEALHDPVWEVRSMAAKSLGCLRNPDAIPALQSILSDPSWWVRHNAAQALLETGVAGVHALEDSAAHHDDRFARDISRQMLEGREPTRVLAEVQP